MLVLTRKRDEQIVIMLGNEIVRVQVLQIDGNKVRLGITAPESVTVHRDEVWRRRAQFASDADPVLVT